MGQTSESVAEIAGRLLRQKNVPRDVKKLAGSALAQHEHEPRKPKQKKR